MSSRRTSASVERRRERRDERDKDRGHSCAAGKTTIEVCMDKIVEITKQALEVRDEMSLEHADPIAIQELEVKYARLKGEVNGMVWIYCYNWVNPYEPYLSGAIKAVRKEAVKRARAQMASEE